MKRLMMFVSLLLAFVMGTWAEDNTKGTDNSNTVSQTIPDTGIDTNNGVVYLNDLEDHTWTYYSGVDVGDYKTKYVGGAYNAGKLYSPNPRNVKITYNGGGIQNAGDGNANAAVGIDASETSFVYFKTLESKKEGDSYVYPYTTIANPFSKRPSRVTTDGKQFYGFAGWKVVMMAGCTLRGSGSTTYSTAEGCNIIPAETEIFFNFTSTYSNNCTSAEVVLEAIWVKAQVTYLTSVTTNNNSYTFNKTVTNEPTTYENNFLVINKDYSGTLTLSQPVTIMMVEPDGSVDYRSNNNKIFKGNITPNNSGVTKIEYAHWQPSGSINARGCNLTIGRGMDMDGTTRTLYGSSTNGAKVNQILKIESGIYSSFLHYGKSGNTSSTASSSSGVPGSIEKQWVTFGCDYDRAGADADADADDKLVIQGEMLVGRYVNLPTDSDKEICRVYSLSGNFMSNTSVSTGTTGDSYYLRGRGIANVGHVYMEILGGKWKGIAGGWGDAEEHAHSTPAFTFRMRGGHLEGSLYGAGEYLGANGTRTFVITGGTIKGWVAGGANGTRLDGGEMDGASFIYVGGNAIINSKNSQKIINRAVGGNVFGAGCGYCDVGTSGEVTRGTNVVIADHAYVERGVYGGGSYGYCSTNETSNIYITGGTIGGIPGGVIATATGGTVNSHAEYRASYTSTIPGGVYGGACQNKGGNVNIYMTGGTVNGGLYGGSNASGALSGNVNMTIAGGNVGSQEKAASVYGGGYGNSTTVNGSTNITMTGGAVNGSVFGGGNQGTVGSNATVTITGGTVTGNVYGGGNQAEVEGQTRVVIGSSGQ